jgi:curved DNA-binding protein CbpA
MPDPFVQLGVPLDADDATIRKRYLEKIREFPPESAPEQFAAIRAAFEKISTLEARANYLLFQRPEEDTLESILEDPSCSNAQPRYKLTQLLQAILKPVNPA